MATFTSNANTKLGLIKEVTFGTTPPTPALTAQRYVSTGGFVPSREELIDESKTGDRQYSYTQQGNTTVSGSIDGVLAHDNYDSLFESVMWDTWTINELVFGSTLTSFTIEQLNTDVTPTISQVIRGAVVNGFSIESSTEGNASVSFDILAKTATVGSSSIDVDGYTPQEMRQPFTHCGGTISEGGTPIASVSSVSLNVSNGMTPLFVWGNCETADLVPDRFEVTGTLVVYFGTVALYNKYLNSTASSLEFTLEDADGNALTFELPNIKYTSAEAPVESGAGQRMLTLNFRGLKGGADATSLKITRSA